MAKKHLRRSNGDFFRGACLELRVLHVPRRKIRSKIPILTASTSKKRFGSHPPTVFPPGNTDGCLKVSTKSLACKIAVGSLVHWYRIWMPEKKFKPWTFRSNEVTNMTAFFVNIFERFHVTYILPSKTNMSPEKKWLYFSTGSFLREMLVFRGSASVSTCLLFAYIFQKSSEVSVVKKGRPSPSTIPSFSRRFPPVPAGYKGG